MRRIVSLILASTLAAVGGTVLAYLLWFATDWRGWMVVAAGFVFAVGAMWLREDLTSQPVQPSGQMPLGRNGVPPR